ncbi:hypothetical protein P8C59_000613 [Phyllachora maydis]|nr:hypothetical protein P8C59_000613 [Phyllachora maydis]
MASAWLNFTTGFQSLSLPFATDVEWSKLSDKVVDLILPDWTKLVPLYVRKLQKELSMAPGSLADEIWHEAHDPTVHPEIQCSAKVRVSEELCEEEKRFLARRKKVVAVALAKYLGLDEDEVHADDVPTIAVCGSGGGLRALVAGTGSLMATAEDGLFDCVTYTSGVSGSCWLQALYNSSITDGHFGRAIDHLKARLGTHIAYPPIAFSALTSAPTNKALLSGMVEKLKGDSHSDFGLVDGYGVLLAARLLVPKGELGVNERDFKLSNQRDYVKFGQNPLPIYTAVRHEIPDLASAVAKDDSIPLADGAKEDAKEQAKKEAWFQWFEMTPYEFFCEEFSAGIPTWALGRKFRNGRDVPTETGLYLPETRLPLLLGVFGSAFCATLSHYYREVRPLVLGLSGFQAVDELISGRNADLSKVHPIDPAQVPNFAYAMGPGQLPATVPPALLRSPYVQLMDAGMSNNIPVYPLLRPGRGVEVVLAFDASADVRTDNWLAVADGYARQRGIKGWPVGIGWPRPDESPAQAEEELGRAQAASPEEADVKLAAAQKEQAARRANAAKGGSSSSSSSSSSPQHSGPSSDTPPSTPPGTEEEDQEKYHAGDPRAGELGYCTVWVGTTQERTSSPPPPPSRALDHEDARSWHHTLGAPDAGLAVVYLPFLANEARVPGVDPAASEYMSTWNFVYTPEQIDRVVALARANYAEGRARIRATVRAVYERKRRLRLEREEGARRERFRRSVRSGMVGKLGEGDHFS